MPWEYSDSRNKMKTLIFMLHVPRWTFLKILVYRFWAAWKQVETEFHRKWNIFEFSWVLGWVTNRKATPLSIHYVYFVHGHLYPGCGSDCALCTTTLRIFPACAIACTVQNSTDDGCCSLDSVSSFARKWIISPSEREKWNEHNINFNIVRHRHHVCSLLLRLVFHWETTYAPNLHAVAQHIYSRNVLHK